MPPSSLERLATFFATAPAAGKAVRPLAAGARVGLLLDEGPAAFTVRGGAAHLEAGLPADPDFTLRLPGAAVERLTAEGGADVGALGVAFFRLALERDPALRVGIQVQAPAARLVTHGYLSALAQGGLTVGLWLLRKGVKNPLQVIDRLRRP